MDIGWLIDKAINKVKKNFKSEPIKKEHDFRPPIPDGPDIMYVLQYGAWCQADTGNWLTEKCDDPECKWCKNRPEKYNV